MNLIHFSDAHLGSGEVYGRVDPETGHNTHFLDLLRAFDFMVN